MSLAVPAPLDADRFAAFIDALPDSVLRGKGFLRFGDEAGMRLFQLVGRRHRITQWDPATGTPETQLVFLGTPEMPSGDELAERLAAAQSHDR